MSEHYCDYQMPAAVRPVSDVEEALDMLKAAEAGAARLREALVAARKVIERLGAGPENDTAPDFDWLLDVSEDGLALADAALADAQKRIAELEELAELVRRSGCSMHTKYANYIGWSERGAVERIRALAKSAKRT